MSAGALFRPVFAAPPVGDMIHIVITIAITIDEETLKRVDRLARRRGSTTTNRSRLIREAVHEYVARLERQFDEQRESAILRQHRATLGQQAKALMAEQAKP
jgi:metal-responsive CopG/Arc/MetJ family transcriptional regulator